VGVGGGFHATIEQSGNGGEGDGVLQVLQRAKIEIGRGENRRGIVAKISQLLRDTGQRPGAHGTVGHRGKLCGSFRKQ
jgi:hypothetical protein